MNDEDARSISWDCQSKECVTKKGRKKFEETDLEENCAGELVNKDKMTSFDPLGPYETKKRSVIEILAPVSVLVLPRATESDVVHENEAV